MKILLAEDDRWLNDQLAKALRAQLFLVDQAYDGIEAEFLGQEEGYDAIVLDLGLPKKSGMAVLQAWRTNALATPVLILTARDRWQDKVEGLNAGADDYLTKPFIEDELIARLYALIRRAAAQHHVQPQFDGFCLDIAQQSLLTPDHQQLDLTAMEYRLLDYFFRNPGRILSKEKLMASMYDTQAKEHDSNVVEVYIKRLRDKLGPSRIQTRRGQGYVLTHEEK